MTHRHFKSTTTISQNGETKQYEYNYDLDSKNNKFNESYIEKHNDKLTTNFTNSNSKRTLMNDPDLRRDILQNSMFFGNKYSAESLEDIKNKYARIKKSI